jgi:hypothetical protein
MSAEALSDAAPQQGFDAALVALALPKLAGPLGAAAESPPPFHKGEETIENVATRVNDPRALLGSNID